jgi:AAA domain-containing protein
MPALVIDAEGGWKFLDTIGFQGKPLRRRAWNPMTEKPPRYDGTWDVCVVTLRDWKTLAQVYMHLTQSPHDFVSVVIDSITEIQRRCKSNLVGTEQMKIQDWGQLLTQMDSVIRGFRDLTLTESIPISFVLFIAESRKDDDGIIKPYMQGQIGVSLPYWVDICGYLFVDAEDDPTDPNGQRKLPVRKLQIGPHRQVESGERVQGKLPPTISNPNFSDMIEKIFGPEPQEGAKK